MGWPPPPGAPSWPPWSRSLAVPPSSTPPRPCPGTGSAAPHVLRIRGMLEEHYHPATANRMLSALRGVLRECWQAQLISVEDYQAATSLPAVRGESEPRGRNLSAGELRSLFQACSHSS